MNILIAMFAGLAGGAISAFVTGLLTIWICQAFGVSNREGGVGYLAMFLGLFAGVIGLIATIIITLRVRNQSGAAVFAQAPMALAGIIVIGAAAMLWYYYQNDHPITNGAPPILDFELQPPANTVLPNKSAVQVSLQSGAKNFARGWWDDNQPGNVLTGHLELLSRTSNRLLELNFPANNNSYLFRLKLPASPLARKYQQWSEWLPADFLFTPESGVGQRVPADQAWRIRYLVEGIER